MQCPTCVESEVTAFCRECGKGVCETCMERRGGVPYCPECAPPAVDSFAEEPPPVQAPSLSAPAAPGPSRVEVDGPHPFLAGLLGFVPGLGAVYNGQYVKGVVHAVIFGLLIAVTTSSRQDGVQALLVPITIFFVLYMPIEAVRTARALGRGERVEEMSGLVGAMMNTTSRSPVPGVLLIALGVFFLLLTLEIIRIDVVLRAWPVLLIGFGAWRLYASVRAREDAHVQASEGRPADLRE